MKEVRLASGRTLHAPNEAIGSVYFPIHSIVSVVTEMADGKIFEIGIVGREGTTGLGVALGQSRADHRFIVQVPDSARVLSAQRFRAAVNAQPDLNAQVMRYAQATIFSIAQFGACSQMHSVNERCARWLLMAHDRVDGDKIGLTQEFLSHMLGVRRAGVTVAASSLQDAGSISYSRGHISVLDRQRLESASCECYDIVQREWKKIMHYSVSKSPRRGRANV